MMSSLRVEFATSFSRTMRFPSYSTPTTPISAGAVAVRSGCRAPGGKPLEARPPLPRMLICTHFFRWAARGRSRAGLFSEFIFLQYQCAARLEHGHCKAHDRSRVPLHGHRFAQSERPSYGQIERADQKSVEARLSDASPVLTWVIGDISLMRA